MELVKAGWGILFLFFTLILVFMWSKIIVISQKLALIFELLDKSESIEKEDSSSQQDQAITPQKV
ncbi:MAG: hypothetical protein JW795_11875 [Chitinivibrionales bacterium]|nr:hypothetical protein [Chitinivibrionales bacterium]